MSSNAAASTKICPHCGHVNSTRSVFCAECGTSLDELDTDNHPDDSGQTTVSFNPVSTDPDPQATLWGPASDSQATREFTPQQTDNEPFDNRAAPGWQPEPTNAGYMSYRSESRRGFILGIIAIVLIVVIIGFFLWSSVVGEGFRDSITGIF